MINHEASQVALVVKDLSANARDIRDMGLILEPGRSPAEEPGNPLQYSGLENPMDTGAWQGTVHRVAKSKTQLKRLGTQHVCMINHNGEEYKEKNGYIYVYNIYNILYLNIYIYIYLHAFWLKKIFSITLAIWKQNQLGNV